MLFCIDPSPNITHDNLTSYNAEVGWWIYFIGAMVYTIFRADHIIQDLIK